MNSDNLITAGLTLRTARRVVVYTGAGVSAESGIPTFRDAGSGRLGLLRLVLHYEEAISSLSRFDLKAIQSEMLNQSGIIVGITLPLGGFLSTHEARRTSLGLPLCERPLR